jgi:tRNA dimethylallyltransferase
LKQLEQLGQLELLEQLEQLFLKKEVVVLVGGSGLYVDSVLIGLDEFPKVAPTVREKLNLELETKGLESLQNQLKGLDLETYEKIAIENPQRVIRALEICIGSGLPYSSFKNKPKAPRKFTSIKIGLDAERSFIYERINLRVDRMMENGLLEEAKTLYAHRQLNALQTVGYRELFSFFDNEFSQEFAVSEIKKNTRRFAKRQLTWFKRDKEILWFDTKTDIENIISLISEKMNTFKEK